MSRLYPGRPIKEIDEYKHLELDGEGSAGLIDVVVFILLLYLKLDPGSQALGSSQPRV
jgi:hypothetical protein